MASRPFARGLLRGYGDGSLHHAEVTIPCTTGGSGTAGQTLDLPAGRIVVANGDSAVCGPFPAPAGGDGPR